MKKTLLLFSIIILSSNFIIAQSNLYMPTEFAKAYKKGTRSFDGNPGAKYFVNYSDYTINADFNPVTGNLIGAEKIIYHNESNDTLKMIVIRLYKNLFKKGNARDFSIPKEDINDGVNISKLVVNGEKQDVSKLFIRGTNLYVRLKDKLEPKSTINLEIEWDFKMAQTRPIRNGKYGDKVYFVSYWYPQIAVYDDVFGWDKNTYTGATEFYNDHSNFDVKLTIPHPNLLWATGMLQNTTDIFNQKYSNLIKKALTGNDIVNIIKPDDLKQGKILKNNKKNTWHFVASKVPDFAFATSDKHNWDATSISIPDKAERVLVSGVYLDASKNYHSLAEVSRKIISYFSFKKPQIFYPYTAMTVFEGGGGMEFPMMVNEGYMKDLCDYYYVTAHEIGHSYFPFYTGSSETRYAWMDEGLISFFPRLAVDEIFGTCNTEKDIITNYNKTAGNETDLPLMVPSSIFKDFFAYRNIAYNRPAYAFYIIRDYLGDSLFFAALREYTVRWHYKHPYPFDFFFTFNEVAKEDLSWLWKPFFFEFTKPDLALIDVKYKNGLYFNVKNLGGMPQSINVKITLSNGKIQHYKKELDYWKNSDKLEVYIPLSKKPIKIQLDNGNPDVNVENNLFEF
ncbi:MAG: M1 family metallopeptidase [Bacteroidota bacterium]|nr:M1 family metallopeptidase [Bacteroidota bacterium]